MWHKAIQGVVDKCGSHLGRHGKSYVAGMQMTIADFAVAGFAFSYMISDSLKQFPHLQQETNEIIETNSMFSEYLHRIKNLFQPHLMMRPPKPMWDHPME